MESGNSHTSGLKTLDVFSAFNAGSDLWILSQPNKSKWTRKIDWYLNFQIMRSEIHQSPKISKELKDILAMGEYEAPEIEAPQQSALMIASRDLLPNSKTLLVPVASDTKAWILECHAKWVALKRPTARIFLPAGINAEAFVRAWPEADRHATIELVPESLLS